MKKRLKIGFFGVLLIVICVLITVGFGLLPVNLYFAKDKIKSLVQHQLGADLEIHGPMLLKLGFSPQLDASAIELRVPGGNTPPLISIERLTINPAIFDLLLGDLHLRNLWATQMVINYCPEVFPHSESTSSNGERPSFAVDRMTVESLQLKCGQPDKEIALLPQDIKLDLTAGLDMPVSAEISGSVVDENFELVITTASLDKLISATNAIPLSAQLSGFDSRLEFESEILNPFDAPELAATITFESQNPALLLERSGIDLSPVGTLEMKARLLTDFEITQVNQLEMSLGDFSFSANGEAGGFDTRPYVHINAEVPQLDARLLTRGTTEASSDNGWETIDIRPWLDQLRNFDVSLDIAVGEVLNLPFALKTAAISAQLKNGKLQIDQGSMKLDESQLDIKASFDTNSNCPALVSEIQWSGIHLGKMSKLLDESIDLDGHVESANAKIRSCGYNLDDHARSLKIAGELKTAEISLAALEQPFVIDSLFVETGYADSGSLFIKTTLMGEPISAEGSFGSISEIMKESDWPLALEIKSAGGELKLDGNAAMLEDGPSLQGHLEMNIGRLGKLHRWLEIDPETQLRASARTSLMLDEGSWSAAAIDIHFGKSNLRGDLSYNIGVEEPFLTANLESDLLDMGELAQLFPEADEKTARVSFEKPADQHEDEWLESLLELPRIDYKLAVSKIAGLDSDITDIKTEGLIQSKLIRKAQLSLEYEDIKISGNLDVNLQQLPWNLTYGFGADNVDIGRVLSKLDIMQDLKAHAERVDISLVSDGHSVRELVANAHMDSRVESLSWSGQLRPAVVSEDELYLSLVEFTAAPTSKTEWSASGDFNGTPVKFWLQTPPLSETFATSSNLDIRAVLNAGEDVAIADVVIDRSSKDMFKAAITLSGQRFDNNEILLADINPPLKDFQLQTQLSMGANKLQLSKLETSLGTSEITGELQLDLIDDQIKLGTQLRSPRLEINDFVNLMEEWRLANDSGTEEIINTTQSADFSGGFIDIIINLFAGFKAENAIDIEFEAEQIYSDGISLGSGQFQLVADEDNILIRPFHMAVPGGDVDIEFSARHTGDNVNAALKIHFEKLQYGALLRLADPQSKAKGLIYMDTFLEAMAPSWEQIPTGIQGDLELIVIPDDIEAGFLDLWASNLIVALLPVSNNNTKKLNCLAARFEVEDGVMDSKNILLDSTDIIIRGRGSIDLGREQLDLWFAPQAKLEKFLSVSTPIEVIGPFTDFQTGIVSGGFVTTLFKWYLSLIYVPYKWLTGERFPADGIATCFNAMDWEVP